MAPAYLTELVHHNFAVKVLRSENQTLLKSSNIQTKKKEINKKKKKEEEVTNILAPSL